MITVITMVLMTMTMISISMITKAWGAKALPLGQVGW